MRWSSGPCTARARTSLYVGRSGTGSGHTRRLVVPGGGRVVPREHPPGTSSGRPPNRSSVYPSGPTRHRSGGPSTPLSGKRPRSPYSPHAAGPLTARLSLSLKAVMCAVSSAVGDVLGGSPIGVAGAGTGRLSRSPVPRRRARTLHPKLGDGVLADLGLQSSKDG